MDYSDIYLDTHTTAWGRYNPYWNMNTTTTNAISTSNLNLPAHPIWGAKIIFHNPATIVIWSDGSKTVVKCHNEPFDREKGLAMCYMKKILGEKFHRTLRKCEGDCKEICL
jgi:hypothetical protein